jgi:hypothetical protein
MRADFRPQGVNDILFTIEFTMTLMDWKRVREVIGTIDGLPMYHPAARLASFILDAIMFSDKHWNKLPDEQAE